jgi:serine O-acetyltransferase
VNELYQAFKLIKDEFNCTLDYVGAGNQRKKLEQLAQIDNMSSQVTFSGSLSLTQVADKIRQADLLILPSYREGVPNVLLEAFASGVPVVATKIGGIPEVVTQNTGVLVDAEDVNSLAQGLKEALSRQWLQDDILKHAERFDWNTKISQCHSEIVMIFLKDLKYKQAFYRQQGFQTSLLRIFLNDGTSANALYRLTAFFQKFKLLPLVLICQLLNKWLNSCVIGAGAQFEEGLILMHPVGIVINSKVRGGKNVIIESGVVIGDEKGQAPQLGDNIFIGAGAKIIGEITIGNNVKVGANAVVTKDVRDSVTVVGIPAKELERKV